MGGGSSRSRQLDLDSAFCGTETPPTFHLGVQDVFQDGTTGIRSRTPSFDALTVDRTSAGSQRTWGSDQSAAQTSTCWQEMEGPSFYCGYLGFTPVSKPPTNVGVLQSAVKELYFTYRKVSQAGRSATLKLTQKGVLVILFENGEFKRDLFFEFSSVNFVETVKFSPVRTSSERKPKALFMPVDESRGVSEKNAFLVEKSMHFLISSNHPPLVVCVVRRPQGVKALDCHLFALDSPENALHVASLISSAQMGNDAPLRARGSFDRGQHGRDVIRTEYGDYSVYRGGPAPPQNYDGRGGPQYDERRSSQGYEDRGGPSFDPAGGGRNSYPTAPATSQHPHGQPPLGGVTGSIILTQEDFHRTSQPQSKPPFSPTEPPASQHVPYMPNVVPGSAPQFRLPDLLDRSVETPPGASYDDNHHHHHHHQQQQQQQPHVVMRHADNNYNNSNDNNRRFSGGGGGGGVTNFSNRPSDLVSPRYTSGGGPHFPPAPSRPESSGYAQSPRTSTDLMSPRGTPTAFSPTSPPAVGPVFSASNRESRDPDDAVEDEPRFSGKPVAKVPPHLKGIKVLPSDFRAVKLKPKTESKRPDSGTEDYDNNRDIMNKYRDLQEREYSGAGGGPRTSGNYPDGNEFRDAMSAPGRQGHDREFSTHWGEEQGRAGGGGRGPGEPVVGKEAEIASMMSNIRLQNDPNFRQQSRDRSDFEQGLGYLP